MEALPLKSASLLLGGFLLAGAVPASLAGSPPLESLLRNPPFGAPPAAPAGTAPATFEFRGVAAAAGEYEFSVHEVNRHEAAWVKLGEPGRSFVVRRYDPAAETLTIEHAGRSLVLSLQRAVVKTVALVPSLPPPSPPPLPTNAHPGSPLPAALNAPEAQRLQSQADEIRRRRGLRTMPPAETPAPRP